MLERQREVAPFAGAWIEIREDEEGVPAARVAPFAGAWIEIADRADYGEPPASLPSRERGLK